MNTDELRAKTVKRYRKALRHVPPNNRIKRDILSGMLVINEDYVDKAQELQGDALRDILLINFGEEDVVDKKIAKEYLHAKGRINRRQAMLRIYNREIRQI